VSVDTTEDHGAAGAAEPDHEAHQHAHPTDAQYIKVAILLALVTALEVGTYFLEDASTAMLVALLFPMMILKFGVVCAYFMHLKYDNPLFRRVFVFGLVLAVVVYLIALSAMGFWDSGFTDVL
jgi:cytochrome c oxidase subunit 4